MFQQEKHALCHQHRDQHQVPSLVPLLHPSLQFHRPAEVKFTSDTWSPHGKDPFACGSHQASPPSWTLCFHTLTNEITACVALAAVLVPPASRCIAQATSCRLLELSVVEFPRCPSNNQPLATPTLRARVCFTLLSSFALTPPSKQTLIIVHWVQE